MSILRSPILALAALATGLTSLALSACAAPPAPGPPPVVRVGDRTEFGKVALTVTTATLKAQIGEASLPGPGMRFLVVGVKLENNTEYKLIYDRYQFTVQAIDGTVYNALAVPGESSPLQSSTVDPKKDVSGNVTFKVPDSAKAGLVLNYRVPGTTESLRVEISEPSETLD